MMKFYISFFILFTFSVASYGQIDSEEIGFAIPAVESEDPKDDPELIIEPAPEAEEAKPNEDSNAEEDREHKRRRIRILASESRLVGRVSRTIGTGSERRKLNAMLNQLEFKTKKMVDRGMDSSNLLGALSEEVSPHDEAEEMER